MLGTIVVASAGNSGSTLHRSAPGRRPPRDRARYIDAGQPWPSLHSITRRPAAGARSDAKVEPEFPAEATTIGSEHGARSQAMEVALSGPPTPPKLRLITLAIGWEASDRYGRN